MYPMVMRSLLLYLLLLGQALGQSQVKPESWPGHLWADFSKEVDKSGTVFTNIIFDQLDDFSFGHGLGPVDVNVGVRRSVLDNHDVLNTWTVNDEFSFSVGHSDTEFTFPLVPSVTTPVGFTLGVGGKLKVNHIRQVQASRYLDLPTVESLQVEQQQKWYEIDPSIRPRFSKLWNPLLNLYRIPWTTKGLKKLGKGEIISYSTSGFVSVGLEAGFLPLKLPKAIDLSVGAGVQAFVKGEFRITLLKEDDQFVRVKLTKIRSVGEGFTVGAQTSNIQLYEGFLLFEGKPIEVKLLETNITVVPFKFTWEDEFQKQYDLGYRFDLSDEAAQDAFEKCMRGSFAAAGKLAKDGRSVEHILTRNSYQRSHASGIKLGLDWLVNGVSTKKKKDQWITLEKPDGTREIFKSSVELSRAWGTFWGAGERKNFLFSVVLDRDAYEMGEENSFQLISEVRYEDVQTSAKEMHKYVGDVKAVLGPITALPELPYMVPDEEPNKLKKASYHRSSFYFGQYLSQRQLLRFIGTPSADALRIALLAFDGSKLAAKSFHRRWMKLQTRFHPLPKPKEMDNALSDLRSLFNSTGKAVQALRAIVLALPKEEIDFFLTATNNAFGRIQVNGRSRTNAETLLQLADETFEFESRVGNFRSNPEMEIKDFKAVQESENKIRVSFTLPKNSNFLFFKILRTSGWKRRKNIREFIYVNKERFKPGANVWVIQRTSADGLDQEIFNCFKEDEYYTFQMAASPDKQGWGTVSTDRFKYKAPPPPPKTPIRIAWPFGAKKKKG